MNNLLQELKTNPRLRIGLALILVVLWVYGLLELGTLNQTRLESYTRLARKAAQLKSQARQEAWITRASEVATLKTQVESSLWNESSSGLALARWQDWLDDTLNTAGATRHTINISESIGKQPEGQRWQPMRARIEFDSTPDRLNNVLYLLEKAEKLTQIETLTVRANKAELNLIAWTSAASAPAASATASGTQGATR